MASYVATPEAERLVMTWMDTCLKVAKAAEDEAAAGAAVQKFLDEHIGALTDAVLIVAGGLKAGRTVGDRGGGLNKGRLLTWLREEKNRELYDKLVVEETVTQYHINDSALMALATTNPALAAAVTEATDKGTPTASTVRPQKAGQALIKDAIPMPSKKRVAR